MVLLSRKEKEKLVIKLANEGKTIREIAKIVHMSLKDICKIINKATGDEDLSQQEIDRQLENEKQKKWKSLSPYAKAFQMFKDKRPLEDVAIELNIKSNAVLDFYNDFLKLTKMDTVVKIYKELEKDLPLFVHLFNRIKKEGLLNKESITDFVNNYLTLKEMETKIENYRNDIREYQLHKKMLEQEISYLLQKKREI